MKSANNFQSHVITINHNDLCVGIPKCKVQNLVLYRSYGCTSFHEIN